MKLTPKMQKTLLELLEGVTPLSEVNLATYRALCRRGLVEMRGCALYSEPVWLTTKERRPSGASDDPPPSAA